MPAGVEGCITFEGREKWVRARTHTHTCTYTQPARQMYGYERAEILRGTGENNIRKREREDRHTPEGEKRVSE